MTKQIPLTQGKFALVDDEDFDDLAPHKWFYGCDGYAARNSTGTWPRRHTIMMHRVITDAPKGLQVDHINGNKIDNRRRNLRIVTSAQNRYNSNASKGVVGRTSRYKGVSWNPNSRKWSARICENGKDVNLLFTESEVEAALAYNKAAIRIYGEFARLNDISSP